MWRDVEHTRLNFFLIVARDKKNISKIAFKKPHTQAHTLVTVVYCFLFSFSKENELGKFPKHSKKKINKRKKKYKTFI